MRVLVTGAAGFIGSHLSARLVAEGHTVVGVDNFVTGSRDNVRDLATSPSFSLVHADVTHPLEIEGALDWVMHLACPASPPKYLAHPIETLRVSREGSYHLIDLALRKTAQFFLASTSEVYGDPEVHPSPRRTGAG